MHTVQPMTLYPKRMKNAKKIHAKPEKKASIRKLAHLNAT